MSCASHNVCPLYLYLYAHADRCIVAVVASEPAISSSVAVAKSGPDEDQVEESEVDEVDVSQLVFEGEEDVGPRPLARSQSMASVSSAAVTDMVSGA